MRRLPLCGGLRQTRPKPEDWRERQSPAAYPDVQGGSIWALPYQPIKFPTRPPTKLAWFLEAAFLRLAKP